MRELDRIAIEELGIAGFSLMQRAAEATFAAIRARWPLAKSAGIVCGPGNNGGDGYVLAGLMLDAGWQITVITVSDPGQLSGDAQRAYQDHLSRGGSAVPFTSATFPAGTVCFELAVDALLGTGLSREVSGNYREVIDWLNSLPLPRIAMDIPSGLNSDTGQPMPVAVTAELTITYIGMKQGLLTGQARQYCGELLLDQLSLPEQVFTRISRTQQLLTPGTLSHYLPKRNRTAHKGHFGHSLLIGGNVGMSGAIRLAAEAALRTGNGLVTIATHPEHAHWQNLNRPELMIQALSDHKQIRQLTQGKTVLGIGPGLGRDAWAQGILLVTLEAGLPMVLDADALNLLAASPRHYPDWILTPHPAEAARLLDCATADIERDRRLAAQSIQQRYGGVCVLKGAGTLICSAEGTAYCSAGNPGMASAGMGDVLTGIITALRAQGLNAFAAACCGVQLHAQAGDLAARNGERGLLAGDVIAQLRTVVNP